MANAHETLLAVEKFGSIRSNPIDAQEAAKSVLSTSQCRFLAAMILCTVSLLLAPSHSFVHSKHTAY
jgi:hypothetical protein